MGRLDHRAAAGRQDERDVVVLHQLVGAGQADMLQAGNQPARSAGPLGSFGQHPHRLGRTAHGAGVRGHHDPVARLDRDENLNSAVEVGLVDGISAAITPIGQAMSYTLRAGRGG